MNSSDLQHFLTTHAIAAEMVYMQVHTPTVETAAQALGVRMDQVIKSIVLLADDSPLLVIANGISRIDLKRVADHLNLLRKKMKWVEFKKTPSLGNTLSFYGAGCGVSGSQ